MLKTEAPSMLSGRPSLTAGLGLAERVNVPGLSSEATETVSNRGVLLFQCSRVVLLGPGLLQTRVLPLLPVPALLVSRSCYVKSHPTGFQADVKCIT